VLEHSNWTVILGFDSLEQKAGITLGRNVQLKFGSDYIQLSKRAISFYKLIAIGLYLLCADYSLLHYLSLELCSVLFFCLFNVYCHLLTNKRCILLSDE